jgi:ribosomal protein S18 acetylase RimI-like enzyme
MLRFLPEVYPDASTWLHHRLTDIEQNKAVAFVATNRSDIIGLLIATPKSQSRCKLSHIYVVPKARQYGIGRRLLQKFSNFCSINNFLERYLTVPEETVPELHGLLTEISLNRIASQFERYRSKKFEYVYGTPLIARNKN